VTWAAERAAVIHERARDGVLAAGGLGVALGVGAVLASDSTAAPLVLAALAAAAGAMLLVLVVSPGRVGDLLLLLAVAVITVPVKKHFAVREEILGWPGFRVSAADLALLALLPVGALGFLLGRLRNAVPRPVLVVYGLLLAQYAVSVLNAADPLIASFEFASAVHALLIAAVVGAMFRRELLRPVVTLVAVQVAVHTGFALLQAATGRPIGASWFSDVSIVQEGLQSGVVRLRPIGLFDHPIVYADMLMLSLPVLFAGLFLAGGRVWRLTIAATLLMGAAGLALTLSRGAWIGAACAVVTLGILAVRERLVTGVQMLRGTTGAVVAGLLLAAPLGLRTWERLTASDEGNLNVRFELNWVALRIIADRPLTGVGLNHIVREMDAYDPDNVKARLPGPTHNVYLLEAAEAGVPAAALFITLFVCIVVGGVRALAHMPDTGSRWVAVGLLAGLTGFLVSQLADFSHRLEPLRSLVWLYAGLLFALQRGRLAPREGESARA
jgi:putative inorganic carbon (HCO3(-)) transporter